MKINMKKDYKQKPYNKKHDDEKTYNDNKHKENL